MSPTLQGTYPLRRLAWDEAMLKLCGAPVPILHSLNTLPPFPSPPLPSPDSRMQAMAKEPAECPLEASSGGFLREDQLTGFLWQCLSYMRT